MFVLVHFTHLLLFLDFCFVVFHVFAHVALPPVGGQTYYFAIVVATALSVALVHPPAFASSSF